MILGRPQSMTAQECKSLEVFIGEGRCVSRWQLSDEDLEALNRNGGKIYIMIWGEGQPPIAPLVETPFK